MCGIAGFYLKQPSSQSETLQSMGDAIAHRGPDAKGYVGVDGAGELHHWNQSRVGALRLGLAHRRLSIQDLSDRANQPMVSQNGRYWITFGGEIYNFVELRKSLQAQWRTEGDTEVLLELFARYGLQGLSKLNGIFAFAVYDTMRRTLTLVRDPLGVKPLYYTKTPEGLYFGSEIRALLTALPNKPSLRLSLLRRYLLANWIPDPDTLFEGIHKLPPGHHLTVSESGAIAIEPYWDFQFNPNPDRTIGEWEQCLESALEGAVERQLRSDVPVAYFLSGGIDSSLLAAKGFEKNIEKSTAFTIGFSWSDQKDDQLDLQSARLLRQSYDFHHREVMVKPSIVSLLPKIVDALEEPIADPAAICSYLICEQASKEFKVLFSGQGGDELFGGYPYYLNGQIARELKKIPQPLLAVLGGVTQRLPYSTLGKRWQAIHKAKKLFSCLRRPWPESFLYLRSGMLPEDTTQLLTQEVSHEQQGVFTQHQDHLNKVADCDFRHQMMYVDTKTYLPALNLTYTDKTSMAHSVEVRVPFLDQAIVDLVATLPSRYKTRLGETKILLKLLSRNHLPKAIVHRKKTGFGLPLRDWMLHDLQPMAQDLFGEERLKKQKLFKPSVLQRWLQEHRERRSDHSFKLYSLMNLQLWCERFGVAT